jgi:hypothetical protein
MVQKYLGRWSIEVFFKEAKQRLGLGKEQGDQQAQLPGATVAIPRHFPENRAKQPGPFL